MQYAPTTATLEDEIFKCADCGMKYLNSFAATEDVSICKWCSGEES